FFSSRRRHTSFSRDWSSDVCSSDLDQGRGDRAVQVRGRADPGTATGAGGAAGTTRLVGKHVEPARLAPGPDAGSAALPGAHRTGRRRAAATGRGCEGDRAAGARTARG